ncbi:alpha/beta fold hydrolase [Comamonadaceae bacterium OH2545_COT-014]|nr:alpha/beta fold hydrolase [Comamonadaceae bacterium OH2545_COT-014]
MHDDASVRYRAPLWLPGGHAQTIWPALYARRFAGEAPAWRRTRHRTPDGDFIDMDWLAAPPGPGAPWLVLFHGLEGSSRSHYAQAWAHWARLRGWRMVVPHFRGCSGEINQAPRVYRSGDHEEVDWMLARLSAAAAGAPLLAVGVSLGGNALLRWAGEAGGQAARRVRAVAAVCAPVDLAAGAQAMERGFNQRVYGRMFLRSMRPKAMAKLAQYPGLFDARRLRAVQNLRAFDEVFTAPLHGFAHADDYYRRASALPVLPDIRVPALVLNARNDPFVPAAILPRAAQAGRFVTLWQPAEGGHVGFPQGAPPGHVQWLPEAVGAWLGGQV